MIKEDHKKYTSYPAFTIPMSYVGGSKGQGRRDKKLKRALKRISYDTKEYLSDAFIPMVADQTAIQIYYGGAGGGKSVSVALRTIIDMASGKRNFLIVRKVHGTLKDSFYAEMKKACRSLGLSRYFKFTVSPLEIACKLNDRKAIFRGMDDHEKVKSVTVDDGIITDVIIEEATELTEEDYDLLDTRLRGLCEVPKRITILFNPIHKGHWLFKRFFLGRFPDEAVVVTYEIEFSFVDPTGDKPKTVKGKKGIIIHKSTHWDNKFLMPEDHSKYESYKTSNPYMYTVYTCGNWGVLGDIIFPHYKVRDLTKAIKQLDMVYYGLDFGYKGDPFACIAIAIKKGVIYILKETGAHYHVNAKMIKRIRPMVGNNEVLCDNAEPKSIQDMEDAGLDARGVVKWKNNNAYCAQWFRGKQIVVDYRCVNYISNIQGYCYEKDKNGQATLTPRDGNDDYIQAGYYGLNDIINNYRKTTMGR